MDITTLSLAKKYTNKVAAGITAARVEGSSIILTLTDGTEAVCQLPTPRDGISVIDLSIDTDGNLLCHMSDGTTIDAGYVPTVDPDLTNYYTKEEIDKNNYLTVSKKIPFEEPNEWFDMYNCPLSKLSTDNISVFHFLGTPLDNKESLEVIWDGISYNCEYIEGGYWGDLENIPFEINPGSEHIYTKDTAPYHTILIKDIRGNVLGNKIPREYIDLLTNPIKTSELDNDTGFLSIEKLKFIKDSSNSKNIYYYYSISGYESFFNEAGHDPLDVIWDGVSYHVSFDEAGVRWGNYNYEPFDISPMSNRIKTLDTSEYHTVIIKNSKGNILFGNSTLEEYIDIKLPKPQIVVDNITEASIMMSDNANIQLSKPITELFLEYPEVIEIGYHSEITFTMDKTEMSFHPDWGYDGEIKWYGQYVDKYGTPYISHGSTYHIVFTYDVNGMKAVINGDEILNETELTKNKVSTITEESKNNEYPNVNAVKNYVNNAISTSIGDISTILSTLTTVSEVSK